VSDATAANAIRARRHQTNRLIAAHETAKLKPFFDTDAKVIAGSGALIQGAADVLGVFEAAFADPHFVTYARTTETVEISADGTRAAETGTWIGTWRPPEGERTLSGRYLAVWKTRLGQWVIESELYARLA
jgi:ketosteroid isomerase-like protein